MSRTGVEPKPAWRQLPRELRDRVHQVLGAGVRRAERVYGGYSPTPTFRLLLSDGRRAFLKATGPSDSEFARQALLRELRLYRELGDVIAPWAPALLGSYEGEVEAAAAYEVEGGWGSGAPEAGSAVSWRVLLLEDLGPKSVPPWTPGVARGVFRAFADFHRATLGATLPAWLPPAGQHLANFAQAWDRLAAARELDRVAELASGQTIAAMAWLNAVLPQLMATSRTLSEFAGPSALLHSDVRSDNLRWTHGRLRLFDWPHAGIGPAEFDLAAFAQTVTLEGGPEVEQLVAWYAERAPVRQQALDASVAAIAGFFADAAWRPEVPGLPRLRAFQRAQLRVTLAWAARRLALPAPAWLNSSGIP